MKRKCRILFSLEIYEAAAFDFTKEQERKVDHKLFTVQNYSSKFPSLLAGSQSMFFQ